LLTLTERWPVPWTGSTANVTGSFIDQILTDFLRTVLDQKNVPGKSVTKVIFLFLHTGVEVVLDDLPGAMNNVRGAVVGLTA
jgi:hypothetical protein